MTIARRIALAVLGLGLLGTAAQAEVFVAPKPGASQDQFQQDQFQCHQWAQQQTGVNPSQTAMVAAPAPQYGGAIRGAAGGAALNRQNRESAQAAQQAQAQQQGSLQRYDQAYGACLAGRGYQVR